MATRLYPNNTAAGVTPSSWSSGWNVTTGAISRDLSGHIGTIANGTASQTGTGTSGQFRSLIRLVSPPLAAQTIAGTFRGSIKAAETTATDNYTLAVGIKVVQSDGSDRGALLAVTAPDDLANELPTTAASRIFKNVSESSSITLSSLGVSAGDRIVVEVGFLQQSTSTNSGSVIYTEDSRGDGIPDLDFADADTVGVPWVEFSQDIKFQEPFFLRALSVPEDVASSSGGANATSPITFTTAELAPARQGDLIVVEQHTRVNDNPYAIDNAAGQTWTEEAVHNYSTTNYRKRNWCTFDGTWDADLVFSCLTPTCYSAQLLIFRAAEATDTWEQDVALVETEDETTPWGPAAVTTVADEVIVVASWSTADNNSWSAVSGAGWIDIGSAMYRNTSAQDQSDTYAYYWAPTGGTNTGAPTKTQTALAPDNTLCLTQAYKRIAFVVLEIPIVVMAPYKPQ